MKLDNKGFGTKEIMISLLLIILLIVVVSQTILKNTDQIGFTAFVKLANKFGDQAALIRDEDSRFNEELFLIDLLNDHNNYATADDYRSPFSDELCDKYESRLYNYRGEKRVSLKCDNYIIADHVKGAKSVRINKVGPWLAGDTKEAISEMEESNIETDIFYSLDDGSMTNFYMERQFIDQYNKLKGTKFLLLFQVKEVSKIVEKTYYRTNDFVKEK